MDVVVSDRQKRRRKVLTSNLQPENLEQIVVNRVRSGVPAASILLAEVLQTTSCKFFLDHTAQVAVACASCETVRVRCLNG